MTAAPHPSEAAVALAGSLGVSGRVEPAFEAVGTAFRDSMRHARPGSGGAVAVYHRGVPVVDCWQGSRNRAGDPWLRETAALSFSTTKGVVSTLLHTLADEGLLAYDDPVARYWPEFAQAGKEAITIRHLLCHEAGLHRIADMVDSARRVLDWDFMVAALAASRPSLPPGSANAYHALTFGWLAGEVVQRVAGCSLSRALSERLATPLELDGLYCGMPREALARRAELQMPPARPPTEREIRRRRRIVRLVRILSLGRIDLREGIAALTPPRGWEVDWASEEVALGSIPAANGIFTARSLARLYAALAEGGELDGHRLLARETLARMAEIQNRRPDRVLLFRPLWRLGYHRVFTLAGIRSAGFGHAGLGGSGGWADRDRRLALGFVVSGGVGTPLGDARLVRLTRAALRCADRLAVR